SSGLVAMGVEGAIGSTLAAIKPNSKVPLVPKYLYYWLRHQYDLINRNTRGSAIPHVDRDLLLGLLIPIPSLEIQERIVSILERAEILKQDREQANKLSNGIIQS